MPNDNDDMSEEDMLKASTAYLTFVEKFGEYIKEMDPELWERARQYAVDFTNVPGVTVELVDKDEEENDDDEQHREGAD